MDRKITIVGCGPGAPDYVTPAARKAVDAAECVFGSKRLLALFPDAGGERIEIGGDMEKALREIESRRGERKMAVLVSGDCGVYSLATLVIKKFGMAACEIVPGISSVQVAFARVGVDWADAMIVSAHKNDPDDDPERFIDKDKIAILGGRGESARWVARLATRLGGDRAIIVCENLTTDAEKIINVTPEELMTYEAGSLVIFLLINRDILK